MKERKKMSEPLYINISGFCLYISKIRNGVLYIKTPKAMDIKEFFKCLENIFTNRDHVEYISKMSGVSFKYFREIEVEVKGLKLRSKSLKFTAEDLYKKLEARIWEVSHVSTLNVTKLSEREEKVLKKIEEMSKELTFSFVDFKKKILFDLTYSDTEKGVSSGDLVSSVRMDILDAALIAGKYMEYISKRDMVSISKIADNVFNILFRGFTGAKYLSVIDTLVEYWKFGEELKNWYETKGE